MNASTEPVFTWPLSAGYSTKPHIVGRLDCLACCQPNDPCGERARRCTCGGVAHVDIDEMNDEGFTTVCHAYRCDQCGDDLPDVVDDRCDPT